MFHFLTQRHWTIFFFFQYIWAYVSIAVNCICIVGGGRKNIIYENIGTVKELAYKNYLAHSRDSIKY